MCVTYVTYQLYCGLPLGCTGVNLSGQFPVVLRPGTSDLDTFFGTLFPFCLHETAESFIKFTVSGYSVQENRSS